MATTKRVRESRYESFGAQLKAWRGERNVETVVRIVRQTGLKFDAATLRMWEYGWIARPDPVVLLAVARIYGVPTEQMLTALVRARSQADGPIRLGPAIADTPPPVTTIEGFSPIRWLRAPIAAGQPLAIEPDDDADQWLAFQDTWLKPYRDPLCLTVGRNESSMLPTIQPGDVVVIDQRLERRAQPTTGAVYAVNLVALTGETGGTLKRIEITDGHLVIIADNSDKTRYATRAFDLAGLDLTRVLIGLVVWIGRNLAGKRGR